ncbi:GNAT family N-acetyltransferase [Curtobacterium sp. RRHDQ10]|uniref:GNAT family N-acetyltransferase n=1 Tax=Curtobacterium phyllosphaerae TaxID=3413379 RepID=UPI003BF3364E
MTIRAAEPSDVPEILALIHDLAAHQGEPDAVENSAPRLHSVLFGAHPQAFAFVVDAEEPGRLAGMAVWFLTYSTWTGGHGVHLEDLYVRPEYRGAGHGRALIRRLAAECTANGWSRLEWSVLDTNAGAVGFYESMGASFLDAWRTCRLDGAALAEVAGGTA